MYQMQKAIRQKKMITRRMMRKIIPPERLLLVSLPIGSPLPSVTPSAAKVLGAIWTFELTGSIARVNCWRKGSPRMKLFAPFADERAELTRRVHPVDSPF